MRYFQKLILLSLLALFSVLPSAKAQIFGDDPLVKVRILPERSQIQAGEEIWIGIEQIIKPEWHTYWINPGDSGSEPRIKWTLPEGFNISDIHWPTPDKIPYGPLLNYGYSDKVILLQKLQAPETLPAGSLSLKADFEVLVCKDECIPEFSDHELNLNTPGRIETHGGYFAVAKQKLPKETDLEASYSEDGSHFVVVADLDGKELSPNELKTVEYLPKPWGLVDNTADAKASISDGKLIIKQTRSDRELSEVDNVDSVVAYTADDGIKESFSFVAIQSDIAAASLATADITFVQAIIFALIGGLILNLMPCVFPVLSMKALSLVKISEKSNELARMHGLSYTAGVILSFMAIAGLLLIIKAAGYSAGWGFQLQNPIVVSILAYILFIVGLNLSGYFDLSNNFGGLGQKLTQGDGLKNSFFTGVLATLVATPCTAPFMAASIGFALVQPAWISLSVFGALGLGLASPYLLLSYAPALQNKLPKPGPWMDHFKHFLAFPMFGASVWLIWVLSQQAGPTGVLGVLLGMLAISFGIWLIKVMPERGLLRLITKILVIASLATPFATLTVDRGGYSDSMKIDEEMGEVFTPGMLSETLDGNDPVFVEMTAAWCITCKVNHAIAINVPSTRKVFEENNVKYMVGDWTNYDPKITKFLNSYGRNGVPIYVYYGPRNIETGERPNPVVLPQILTPAIVKNAIENS